MICPKCGSLNDKDSLYCKEDGSLLKYVEPVRRIETQYQEICSNCGSSVARSDIYCSNCGKGFFFIDESMGQNQSNKLANETGQAGPGFKNKTPQLTRKLRLTKSSGGVNLSPNPVNSVVYALTSFLVLLLASFIVAGSINNYIGQEYMLDLLGDKSLKIIKSLDILLISNGIQLNLTGGSSELGGFTLLFKLSLFPILLLAILLFFFSGFIKGLREIKKGRSFNLAENLLNSLVYSLLIVTIAGINRSVDQSLGKLLSLVLPFDLDFVGDMGLIKSFSLLSAFKNSFLLSFMFLNLGNLLALRSNENLRLSKYRGFYEGANLFLLVFIIIFISTSILGVIDLQGKDIFRLLESASIQQVAAYGLGVANLGVIKGVLEGEEVSYSILGDIAFYEEYRLVYFFFTIFIFLIFMVFAKNKTASLSKTVFLAPVSYSILIFLFYSLLTIKIGYSFSGNYYMEAVAEDYISGGFSPLIILTSLAISGLGSLAGYFLGARGKKV